MINGYKHIFFLQERIGHNGKFFLLCKLRTLTENETLPLHERQFGLGAFFRRTSIDELPQIWNILKGEMSFIGPRPLPTYYLHLFSADQQRRHMVRPGITGWAQVNGRHSISWEKKFEHDLYYITHVSFWLDVRIFLKTIILLMPLKKDLSLSEEEFKGNA